MCGNTPLHSWSPQWTLVPWEEEVRSSMQFLSIKSPKDQEPDIRPRVYTAPFDMSVALTPNSRRLIKAGLCQQLAESGL